MQKIKIVLRLWWITRNFSFCVELVVQIPARGSTQVLLCLFPGVLWLWHFPYSVGTHTVPSLHIYTVVVLRAFMAGASRRRWLLPGTWSHLWFAGVLKCPPWCSIVGATVTVHQFFCLLHSIHSRISIQLEVGILNSRHVLIIFRNDLVFYTCTTFGVRSNIFG